MQSAHPQERAVPPSFDGEQAQPLPRVAFLGPLGDVVGVLAAQRAPEVAGHLGVGVAGRIQRQPERPQHQPGVVSTTVPFHSTIRCLPRLVHKVRRAAYGMRRGRS